jgi:hypothetical protein
LEHNVSIRPMFGTFHLIVDKEYNQYIIKYTSQANKISFYLSRDPDDQVLNSFLMIAIEIFGDQTKYLLEKLNQAGLSNQDINQKMKELDETIEKTKLLFKKSLE